MTTMISFERLSQICSEVKMFEEFYRLGIFTLWEYLNEVNARRMEMGYLQITEDDFTRRKRPTLAIVRRADG